MASSWWVDRAIMRPFCIHQRWRLSLNVWAPSYLGLTRSISWLLMPWLLASPGHQRPWYRLFKIGPCLLRGSFFTSSLISVWRINTICKYMFILLLRIISAPHAKDESLFGINALNYLKDYSISNYSKIANAQIVVTSYNENVSDAIPSHLTHRRCPWYQ